MDELLAVSHTELGSEVTDLSLGTEEVSCPLGAMMRPGDDPSATTKFHSPGPNISCTVRFVVNSFTGARVDTPIACGGGSDDAFSASSEATIAAFFPSIH